MLKKIVALSFVVGLSCTGTASAQHNLPTMNTMGRFFGIGWNQGYHSGQHDGRFKVTKDKHPASNYASKALLYPFHPSYSATPQSGSSAMSGDSMTHHSSMGSRLESLKQHGMPFGVKSRVERGGGAITQSGAIPNQAVPPVAPAMLAEPATTWLRPFLKVNKATSEAPIELLPEKTREDLLPADFDSAEGSSSDRSKSNATGDDDDLLIPSAQLTPM